MATKLKSTLSSFLLVCGLASAAAIGLASSVGHATGATNSPSNESCGLPICNIPAKIDELSSVPQGVRFEAVSKLRKTYKKSTNPAEWENLLSFADQAIPAFTKLGDEDWMIREVEGLADDAVMALIRFHRPIETDYLVGMFSRITNENRRFEALKAWNQIIPSFDDRDALSNLLAFGNQAKAISLKLGDADWVVEEAARTASLATARLVALDPAHEGVFDIKSLCKGPDCDNYPEMKTMIVMETTERGGNGLVITFPLSTGGTPAYSFFSAAFRDGPSTVVATSGPAGGASPRPAELVVKFDRSTGEVTGVIRDTRSKGSWKFKGKAVRRVLSVPSLPSSGTAPEPDEITGTYEGLVDGIQSSLIIRKTVNGLLYASLVNHRYALDFKIGTYVPQKALLSLVYIGNNANIVKAALKLDKVGTVISAQGFSYTSRNNVSVDWKLVRTHSVDQDEIE